jgi:hypothetical protein
MQRRAPAPPSTLSYNRGSSRRIFTESEFVNDGFDDFEDARAELRSSGHNLTSVLINPRESMFDNLFDEFETEQSAPVDRLNAYSFPDVDLKRTKQVLDAIGEHYEHYVSNHARKLESLVPTAEDVEKCFRLVPELFFREDFELHDPETFDSTLGARAAHNMDEKLTTYLDLVEVVLLKQISSRSPAFFRALTDIQQLRGRVQEVVTNIRRLRHTVRSVDDKVAVGSLRVPKLSRRHANLAVLHDKLELVQQVLKARDTVQELLAAEDFLTALDVIRGAKEVRPCHSMY